MKKIISILLSTTMIFTMITGCSANTDTKVADKNTNKDTETDTLVMYTNAEFAPFEYFKGEEIVGVDIDIANEIAKDLGKKVVVEHTDFDSLIPSLVTGKADFVAAGMNITPEREEEVDFSISYGASIQNIISTKDAKLQSMEDLKGKKIGVQLGTTSDLILSDEISLEDGALNGSGAEVKPYSSPLEAAQDLLTGRLDAVVIDNLTAEEIAKNNSDKLVTVQFGDIYEPYGIAVQEDNKELLDAINVTLQRLIDEGKIEEFIINHSN